MLQPEDFVLQVQLTRGVMGGCMCMQGRTLRVPVRAVALWEGVDG